MGCKGVYSKIVSGTRRYFREAGFSRAVVGLSGGIDSALVAFILADALGKDYVTALLLPDSSVNNSTGHLDALEVAKSLGIAFEAISIDRIVGAIEESVKWEQSGMARMNARARARMVLLYDFASSRHALVAGTSNKSELMLGYFTKHGDGAADFLPLGNLFKADVFALARFRGVPGKIVEKAPSSGLAVGITDEAELGAPYAQIDPVLKEIENGRSPAWLKKRFDALLVGRVLERIKANAHKLR